MTPKATGLAVLCGLATCAAPMAALASGGGMGGSAGGGQMPSISAPQFDPVQEYRDGMTSYQAGKFKEAARNFEHVTEAEPREAHGWYMLGMARVGANDAKGAAHAFERSLKVDSTSIDSRREYAVALARLKQNDKASAELAALKSRAAACNDTCADAANLKAAIVAVEQALASPGAGSASLGAPASLASTAAGDVAYVRAVSLINEHRFVEALAALDEAEAVFGPHPDILTYQGYAWRKLGQLDRAEGYYKAALAVAPAHRGATEYYGELKVIRGDMSGARAMLAKLDGQCAFGCVEAEDLRRWIDHGGDPAS